MCCLGGVFVGELTGRVDVSPVGVWSVVVLVGSLISWCVRG